MNSKIAIFCIFATQMSIFNSLAFSDDGQFAVLKTEKSCRIVTPPGKHHSPVYFSKDCKTAYVLPSLKMTKTILNPYLTTDLGICERREQAVASVKRNLDRIIYYEKIIDKVTDQKAIETDPEKIKIIDEKINSFSKMLKDIILYKNSLLKEYDNTRAMRTQINVESDVMNEVAAFQLANLTQVNNENESYPTNFVPAHITDSYLSVSLKDNNTNGTSVLNVNFPGVEYVSLNQTDLKKILPKNSTILEMNGSMSGIVDISATTLCSTLKEFKIDFQNNSNYLKDIFDAAIAINLNYKVNVQAGLKVELSSSIDTIDFLNHFSDKITKNTYSKLELIESMINGEVLNKFTVKVDDKGEPKDLKEILTKKDNDDGIAEKINIITPILSTFIKNYFDKIEDKLTSLGIIKPSDKNAAQHEARAVEVNGGTTHELSKIVTICSQSKVLFIKGSKECKSEPTYVEVNHQGLSDLIKNRTDNSIISDQVIIETNEVTKINHTSTFGTNN